VLVQSGRPGRIAEALTALVNDERLRAGLGAAALTHPVSYVDVDFWY